MMVVVVVVAAVIVAVVAVVMAVTAATIYGLLVNTIIVRMKTMNVAMFVVLRLACTYDVGRYVLFILTVAGGTKKK